MTNALQEQQNRFGNLARLCFHTGSVIATLAMMSLTSPVETIPSFDRPCPPTSYLYIHTKYQPDPSDDVIITSRWATAKPHLHLEDVHGVSNTKIHSILFFGYLIMHKRQVIIDIIEIGLRTHTLSVKTDKSNTDGSLRFFRKIKKCY